MLIRTLTWPFEEHVDQAIWVAGVLVSVMAVAGAYRGRWWSAGIWGGLTALTRPNGILIGLPLFLMAVLDRAGARSDRSGPLLPVLLESHRRPVVLAPRRGALGLLGRKPTLGTTGSGHRGGATRWARGISHPAPRSLPIN